LGTISTNLVSRMFRIIYSMERRLGSKFAFIGVGRFCGSLPKKHFHVFFRCKKFCMWNNCRHIQKEGGIPMTIDKIQSPLMYKIGNIQSVFGSSVFLQLHHFIVMVKLPSIIIMRDGLAVVAKKLVKPLVKRITCTARV